MQWYHSLKIHLKSTLLWGSEKHYLKTFPSTYKLLLRLRTQCYHLPNSRQSWLSQAQYMQKTGFYLRHIVVLQLLCHSNIACFPLVRGFFPKRHWNLTYNPNICLLFPHFPDQPVLHQQGPICKSRKPSSLGKRNPLTHHFLKWNKGEEINEAAAGPLPSSYLPHSFYPQKTQHLTWTFHTSLPWNIPTFLSRKGIIEVGCGRNQFT